MGSEAKEEIIFGLYFSLLAETQSNAENYFATLCAFARDLTWQAVKRVGF